MKKTSLTMFLVVFVALTCASIGHAVTLTSGSYSSSFDCTGWPASAPHDVGNCEDFYTMNSGTNLCGERTEARAEWNNPLGSGKAIRVVVGDGTNTYTSTGGFRGLNGADEIWIRWYMKYELGFTWTGGGPGYDKIIYLYTEPYPNHGTAPIFEWYGADGVRLYVGTDTRADFGHGWQSTMGGPTGDGQWHSFEFHLKIDTNGSNGIYQAWIDGNQVADHHDMNLGGADYDWFIFYSNQATPSNGGCSYVYLDDVAIYTVNPPNVDADGNPYIGTLDGVVGASPPVVVSPPPAPDVTPVPDVPTSPDVTPTPDGTPSELLFEETFEDTNLAGRGWYDNTSPILTTTEGFSGSARSLEFRFAPGATAPVNGGAMRKKFAASDSVYLRYYVKYSNNWVGSQKSYHPHEFMFMTNKDSDWSGMAYTYLTAYVEENALKPRLAIQDGRNVDLSNLNVNLVNTTENRSVAGCNGDSDGYGNGDCYAAGSGQYWNDKHWFVDNATISPGNWHKVEAFFKLNSIAGGIGVANGVMQYWLDDQLLIDHDNVMFRTAQHADMLFNQFIIAPWIGDGSPVDQTFWVDDLYLATAPPTGSAIMPPTPPSNLRLIQ